MSMVIPESFRQIDANQIPSTRSLLLADTGGKNIFLTLSENPKEWVEKWVSKNAIHTYTFYLYSGENEQNILNEITRKNQGTWFEDTFSFPRR